MAKQNSFLCECGRVLTRPLAHRNPRWTPEMSTESQFGLPWDFVPGDIVHKGVRCGGKHKSCGIEFVWLKPPSGDDYVNVRKVV